MSETTANQAPEATLQETLDKTIKWLDTTGKDGQAGLRRLVSEGRDALDRALKAQARDK